MKTFLLEAYSAAHTHTWTHTYIHTHTHTHAHTHTHTHTHTQAENQLMLLEACVDCVRLFEKSETRCHICTAWQGSTRRRALPKPRFGGFLISCPDFA